MEGADTSARAAPAMFTHLLASKPPRQGKAAVAATLGSVAFHGALLGALVWATLALGAEEEEVVEEVTFIQLPEEAPPPEPPPLPELEAEPPAAEAEVVPRGFQVLAIPDVIPPDIPPPSTGVEIREADYLGEGVEGGKASGEPVKVTTESVEAAPTFTPFTVAPVLKNAEAVQRALERHYPPLLRDAGIGGTVLVWFLIDENGKVMGTQVNTSSGYEELDRAALKVGEVMRFSPAYNRDQRVKVWVALPITFVVH